MEIEEHKFKCPKCGSLNIEVKRKTKLDLHCRRCEYYWKEQTLDKREIWVASVKPEKGP